MKRIIKPILIALTIVCAIYCSKVIQPLENPTSNDNKSSVNPRSITDSLSYELKQKHFETWHQIEHYIGSNHEEHKIVDVNLAWLEFSDGNCSDSIFFEVVFRPQYPSQLNCKNPESYLNTYIHYDNGFQLGEDFIECSFVIESFDNLIFSINGKNIEFAPPELQYCPITPISLYIKNIENRCIYATLQVEIYHPDNVLVIGNTTSTVESVEIIEIPLTMNY